MGTASQLLCHSRTADLKLIESPAKHIFVKPTKRINSEHDVQFFLNSKAYRDISLFILKLNLSMYPRKCASGISNLWRLDAPIEFIEPVQKLQEFLKRCDAIIDQVPPDTGPRRFGNVSFRRWYEILESQVLDSLEQYLPNSVLSCGMATDNHISVLDELIPYLMGSFGSSQRLDYGTGHELNFLAFLGILWKLGAFNQEGFEDETIARSIVIRVIEPYWRIIRRLILTYTLEPAGSHGVWGLDDHFFLPYIFGSSQYSPAIDNKDLIPIEGSHPDAPSPSDISNNKVVQVEREKNIFFSAIGFIFDVKKGPFWEHSPMLYDISGVRTGWGKINKVFISDQIE